MVQFQQLSQTVDTFRCQLMRLKMGDHLTHVVRGGAKHLIAPAEEVLALKPELAAAA